MASQPHFQLFSLIDELDPLLLITIELNPLMVMKISVFPVWPTRSYFPDM